MLLIGNSFPLSLIRQKVTIEPEDVDKLKRRLKSEHIESFWGHNNTLKTVSEYLDYDLKPKSKRPVIALNNLGYPTFAETEYKEIWV